MAGGCLLIFRRIRVFTLLGAVPWLFIGWRGDFYAFLFSLIGYFASVVFFEAIEGPVDEYVYSGRIPRPVDVARFLLPALAVGVVGILPLIRMSGPLLLLLAAPLSTLPLAIAVALAMRVLKRDDEHRVFRSLPLRPGRPAVLPAATPSFRKAVVLMVALVAAAGILSLSDASRPASSGGANSGEALSIPLPKRYTASRSWDFPDLMRIIEGHGKAETGELPDLADFVVHEAYQQGLAYGREAFRLPAENEAVTVADFASGSDGTLRKTERVAIRFSRAWLSTVLNRQGLPPLERMLIDLGSPSVVKRLPYAPSVSALPETGEIVISAAVFAVFGLFAAGAGIFRRKVRAIVTWSKQQET
jgi:LPXTG-motif cell wall-anchored protein